MLSAHWDEDLMFCLFSSISSFLLEAINLTFPSQFDSKQLGMYCYILSLLLQKVYAVHKSCPSKWMKKFHNPTDVWPK